MRNKISLFIALILSLICLSVLTAEETTNEFSGFNLSFKPDDKNNSVYEIGFSSNEIKNVSTTVSRKSSIDLQSDKETTLYEEKNGEKKVYYTATDVNKWVYWKIVSPHDLTVKLRPSGPMTVIHALSETEEESGSEPLSTNDIEWAIFEYSENGDSGVQIPTSWTTSANPGLTIDVEKNGYQASGSYRFITRARIPQQGILNYRATTYSATLIAEVITND